MGLNDTQIKKLKPSDRVFRVGDGDGLSLEVRPSGGKIWRFNFTKPDGKRSTLSLGKYPAVSLRGARDRAAE
ncbi:MAG: Arm DNA-binding domain-containing protein, partial [Desulfatiglandales bacterium]